MEEKEIQQIEGLVEKKLEEKTKPLRTPIPRKMLYALLASYVSVVLMTALVLVYANQIDKNSNRTWCEFLTTIDDGFKANPPQAEAAKKISIAVRKQRVDFEC